MCPLDRCFERRGWTHIRGGFLVLDGRGLRVFSREYRRGARPRLPCHATSTGSEQPLKHHMTEIATGFLPRQQEQVVFPPEHEAPRAWPPSLGVRPAKMLASLVAYRARPTRTTSEWSTTKVHEASALRGPLHCHF